MLPGSQPTSEPLGGRSWRNWAQCSEEAAGLLGKHCILGRGDPKRLEKPLEMTFKLRPVLAPKVNAEETHSWRMSCFCKVPENGKERGVF